MKIITIMLLFGFYRHVDGDLMNNSLKWGEKWWRSLLSEMIATALLIGVSAGVSIPVRVPRSLTDKALTTGFVLTALVTAFGDISGAHMNPALTVAAVIFKKINIITAVAYIIAQLVGSVIGFGALVAILPAHLRREFKNGTEVLHGCTLPNVEITELSAMAAEAILTGLLTIVLCTIWANPKKDPAGPIKMGMTLASLMYVGVPITSASMDPARTFGPAVWQGCWSSHWVYWVGPIGGAAVTTVLYRWVLTKPPRSESSLAEAIEKH